jgi:hypothetical protein
MIFSDLASPAEAGLRHSRPKDGVASLAYGGKSLHTPHQVRGRPFGIML